MDHSRNPNTGERLEEKIEEATAEGLVKMGLKKLPLLPDHRTRQAQSVR